MGLDRGLGFSCVPPARTLSSNIHYLRISSDTELKGMVSHLYVFWKESLNIYYLWKAEDINCKCIFFTCIYSQLSLQITIKWKCLLALIVWVCFLTSMYFQVSFQISFILRAWFLNCVYYQMSLQILFCEKAFGHWLQG